MLTTLVFFTNPVVNIVVAVVIVVPKGILSLHTSPQYRPQQAEQHQLSAKLGPQWGGGTLVGGSGFQSKLTDCFQRHAAQLIKYFLFLFCLLLRFYGGWFEFFFSGLRVPTSPSQVEVGRVRDGFVLQYKSSLKRGTTTTRGVIMVLISFWVATRGVVDHFTFTTFARRVDSSLLEDKLLEGFFLESETKFGFDINSATHKLQSYCYGSMYLRHVSPGAGGFIDQWNWCSIPIPPLTEGQRKSGLVSEQFSLLWGRLREKRGLRNQEVYDDVQLLPINYSYNQRGKKLKKVHYQKHWRKKTHLYIISELNNIPELLFSIYTYNCRKRRKF